MEGRKLNVDDNPTSWFIHKIGNDLVVTGVVMRIGSKLWLARISAPGIEARTKAESLQQARAFLLDFFHDRFPQHRCTEQCESYGMAPLLRVTSA